MIKGAEETETSSRVPSLARRWVSRVVCSPRSRHCMIHSAAAARSGGKMSWLTGLPRTCAAEWPKRRWNSWLTHCPRNDASTMTRGSGEFWKSCSRYWRRVLRTSSELIFLGFFSLELAFPELSAGFFSRELFSAELQERENGCATGLGTAGGTNVGGAPCSSA